MPSDPPATPTATLNATPTATGPTAGAPDDITGPRIYGVVDVLRLDRIAGWVIDRRDARAALDVEIRREGRTVAVVRADRPRRDLEKTGVGTGRYGFSCDLSPPLEPGFEFTVTATARTSDGSNAELRRPAGKANAEPERRVLERIYEAVSRPQPAPNDEKLAEMIARLELVQARIEATLGTVEPGGPDPQVGLRILAGSALALGLGSLAIGIVSMLM